jgi:hypothetical protein
LVDAFDERVELANFGLRIGRVAQHAESEFPGWQRLERRAAGKQEKRG